MNLLPLIKTKASYFFIFFCFFRCFALLFHSYEHRKRDESSEVYVTLKKKKNHKDKICMLMYITWVFFCFFFFLIIFLRGNWFKIEQWQRESTWRFACSQETQEPTREYISRTVKIGCISFMKILLCIAGGTQWIYLVHLPHRSDLLYYCTSCLRLIFRQTCIFRENENACADRKF